MRPSGRPYAIAIICGITLWTLTAWVGERTEPWDSPLYWTTSYPIAIVLAGALGYAFPQRSWRWALTLMFTQVAVMMAGGPGLGLLPLGLVLLGVLSLPAVAIAALGARIRARKSPAPTRPTPPPCAGTRR